MSGLTLKKRMLPLGSIQTSAATMPPGSAAMSWWARASSGTFCSPVPSIPMRCTTVLAAPPVASTIHMFAPSQSISARLQYGDGWGVHQTTSPSASMM